MERNFNWRFQVSALAFSIGAFGILCSASIAQASETAPAVRVRELSASDLLRMGIYESSFRTLSQYQRNTVTPDWTIPGGPEGNGRGTGGNPPPCPKGVNPNQTPPIVGPVGPIINIFTPDGPVGCLPTTPGDTIPPVPNPLPPYTPPTYPTWGTDPMPTDGTIGKIGGAVIVLERIVNLGKDVWQFIKDGHAVVNIDTPSASALPQGVSSAAELEGWEPKTKNYQIIVPGDGKNKKVEFVFRLTFWHSGSYRGFGSYIANLTVQAADYKVNWGQEFNVRARIPNEGLVNVSKDSTNPIAGAQVLVEWSRGKVFSTHGNSAVIYVRGDGQMKNLSAPDEEPEEIYPIGKGSGQRRR
ncbi:MAG: hypothetical protein ACJ763_09805 [Bdellovibrionia bacterium]